MTALLEVEALTLDRAGNLINCQSRDDDQPSFGQAGSPVKLMIS